MFESPTKDSESLKDFESIRHHIQTELIKRYSAGGEGRISDEKALEWIELYAPRYNDEIFSDEPNEENSKIIESYTTDPNRALEDIESRLYAEPNERSCVIEKTTQLSAVFSDIILCPASFFSLYVYCTLHREPVFPSVICLSIRHAYLNDMNTIILPSSIEG